MSRELFRLVGVWSGCWVVRPLDVTLPLLPTSLYYTHRYLIPLFAGMLVVISTS
jgi:hypothetical protein